MKNDIHLSSKTISYRIPDSARKKRSLLEVIPSIHHKPEPGRYLVEVREVLWGNTLLNVRHFECGVPITLGEGKGCTFSIFNDYLENGPHTLVPPDSKHRSLIRFQRKSGGWVYRDHEKLTLDDALASGLASRDGNGIVLNLSPDVGATANFGPFSYHLRLVNPESLKRTPLIRRIDTPFSSVMTLLYMGLFLLVAWINTLPAPEVADILDDVRDRWDGRSLAALQELIEKPKIDSVKFTSQPKSLGKEGRTGTEKSELDTTQGSSKRRLEDEAVASHAGILGAMDTGFERMDRLFGSGGLGAGLEKTLGMLQGIPDMDMRGTGGLGSRGPGSGGGGDALGIGGIGTRGRLGGKTNLKYGIGDSDPLKKNNMLANVETGTSTVIGGLDKSVIARVIRKHHSQFRYCYQKELQKNPRLYGKISVQFTIGAAGSVSSSAIRVSTLKNHAVEQCVSLTMKRILFPQPKQGGVVVVTYPFIFNSKD